MMMHGLANPKPQYPLYLLCAKQSNCFIPLPTLIDEVAAREQLIS
jgi:hypothetical protein